jgi:hypothetical protein
MPRACEDFPLRTASAVRRGLRPYLMDQALGLRSQSATAVAAACVVLHANEVVSWQPEVTVELSPTWAPTWRPQIEMIVIADSRPLKSPALRV